MKKTPIYAALDLHSTTSVLGSMDHEGNSLGKRRFVTAAETLQQEVTGLGSKHRRVHLTLEAGALTRWAVGIVRPLVERLVICDPRHNRLINANPNKRDELDVAGCVCFVYELLNDRTFIVLLPRVQGIILQ